MELLVVVNAPGEISTRLQPILKSTKRLSNKLKVSCFLSPCQFASGEEISLLEQVEGLDHIIPPLLYLKILFYGRSPSKERRGVVLHLGGDPIHSLFLAKRLNWKAAIYTYGPFHYLYRYFDKVMVLDEKVKRDFIYKGVSKEKIEVVGELIVDSVKKDTYPCHEDIIGLLPGSRIVHFNHLLPLLVEVGDILFKYFPSFRFLLLLAKSIRNHPIIRRDYIRTPSGGRIDVVKNGIERLGGAKLVITIPGSNTGQLAALGVPMLVILPLHLPHLLPLEGSVNFVDRIPFLGSYIKSYFAKKAAAKHRFIALPNIRVNKAIVPETKGLLTPEIIATEAVRYLENLEREKVSLELKRAMGEEGTSTRMAQLVISMMEE
jgi:lipid-A-disaccharide synthase